jgi:hypothetical protein
MALYKNQIFLYSGVGFKFFHPIPQTSAPKEKNPWKQKRYYAAIVNAKNASSEKQVAYRKTAP